jgi:NADPH-dependent F420 reductase
MLVADECRRIAEDFYGQDASGRITGNSNSTVIKESDVVVIAVPPLYVREFTRQIRADCRPDHIVITTVVPMRKEGGLFRKPLETENQASHLSEAEIIAGEIQVAPVVSAFQTVPASYLANLNSILNIDVLISGDDERALDITSQLVRDIPNLRPLRVGPLLNSRLVESITPLLLNAVILNKLSDPSIRIAPWLPTDFEK